MAALLGLALLQPKTGQAEAVVADGINGFGIELYQSLREEHDDNLIVSPLSIALALGLVLPGADDEAAAALQAALGLVDTESATQALSSLQKVVQTRNESDGITLTIANGGFVHRDLQLNPAYVDSLAQQYGLGMQSVDYNEPEAARAVINAWVAQRTNDLIEDLLPEGSIDRQARLTLVNAIYLLAEWRHTFDEARTTAQPFHFLVGTEDEVPTMRADFTVPVVMADDHQAVELSYRGGELSMLIVVPDDLSAFEESLHAERLQTIIDSLEARPIELWLPKVEAGFNISLRAALERLGMQRLFCGRCNPLAEIAPPAELSVFDVVHETYLRMDETSTEAAAATGVVVGVTSVPTQSPLVFRVDRPFLMALRDRATGTLLFLGRVTDPR